MTNEDVHEAINKWLKGLTGLTFIMDRQSIKPPAMPYGMTDLSIVRTLRQRVSDISYVETDVENSEGKLEIMATPVMELEWTFLVFCYGDNCEDVLRRVKMAMHLPQVQEPLMPDLVIHEIGNVNSVPEFVNERWEPRAQVNLSVRGVSSDGFVIDTIEEHEPLVISTTT